MLSQYFDPIVAVATAPGRGAVGIVRVSGGSLLPLIKRLFLKTLTPRMAHYLPIRDEEGLVLDHGLVLYFPGPDSFTGEDILELQAHGGPIVLQLLVNLCLKAGARINSVTNLPCCPGIRLAQPGEFSHRAFTNGKIDLAQAEAIADLIDATTEAAVRGATRSLTGEFSKEIYKVRDKLIHLRMLVEATLDFPEEEINFLNKADALGQLKVLKQNIKEIIGKAKQGALLKEGVKVVIAGQPNAGKSSLLNALAGAELAIVTAVAGTTRDKVQQTIQIEGVPIHVIDTAGLRNSEDEVELLGIERTWLAIEDADAVLFLHDLTKKSDDKYLAADAQIESRIKRNSSKAMMIDVWNKSDAVPLSEQTNKLCLSAKTGVGLDGLRKEILIAAGWTNITGGVFLARERHLVALKTAESNLEIAEVHFVGKGQGEKLDLLAEELRLAQQTLAQITGEFSADDLLGEIFSNFCIGK